jgi:hypothetical protein
MNQSDSRFRALAGAAVMFVALGGLLAACSRPTAAPTAGLSAPVPAGTFPPVLQPGDEGYPPIYPSVPVPDSYPGPGEIVTDTMAITATQTSVP